MAGLGRVRNTVTTPIGDLVLVADVDGVLHGAEWADCLDRLPAELSGSARGRLPQPVCNAVRAYFEGAMAALEPIRVAASGTPFQRAVWEALRAIPPGTTLTYGALARMLGRPGGARSVGHANGANPISVVVPCHRLVAAGGSLTGYGGGLDRKQWLLAHEARHGRHRAAVPGGG
jgi:methylated-DNA-[protein]-cysteine S-methyltransferase